MCRDMGISHFPSMSWMNKQKVCHSLWLSVALCDRPRFQFKLGIQTLARNETVNTLETTRRRRTTPRRDVGRSGPSVRPSVRPSVEDWIHTRWHEQEVRDVLYECSSTVRQYTDGEKQCIYTPGSVFLCTEQKVYRV